MMIPNFIGDKISQINPLKNKSESNLVSLFISYMESRNEYNLLSPKIDDNKVAVTYKNKPYLFIFKHFKKGINEEEQKELDDLNKIQGFENVYVVVFNKINGKTDTNTYKSFHDSKLIWRAVPNHKNDDWHKYTIIKF